MPTPIAHASAGVATVLLTLGPGISRKSLPWLVVGGASAGAAADLYFLAPSWYLLGLHSLLMAVTLWSLAVVLGERWRSRIPEALALAYTSHCLLDFLFTKLSRGPALFWPLTRTRYRLGWVGISDQLNNQPWSVLLINILLELGLFVLPALWLVWLRWRSPGQGKRWQTSAGKN